MTRLPTHHAERLAGRTSKAATASVLTLAALVAACGDSAPTMLQGETAARAVSATAAVPQTTVSATSCATIAGASPDWREIRVPPTSGTYSDGYVTITLTMDGRYFSWSAASSATTGIDAVLGRAAPSASLYRYAPPEERSSDAGLSGPINKTRPSAPSAQVRTIIFCYDFDPGIAS